MNFAKEVEKILDKYEASDKKLDFTTFVMRQPVFQKVKAAIEYRESGRLEYLTSPDMLRLHLKRDKLLGWFLTGSPTDCDMSKKDKDMIVKAVCGGGVKDTTSHTTHTWNRENEDKIEKALRKDTKCLKAVLDLAILFRNIDFFVFAMDLAMDELDIYQCHVMVLRFVYQLTTIRSDTYEADLEDLEELFDKDFDWVNFYYSRKIMKDVVDLQNWMEGEKTLTKLFTKCLDGKSSRTKSEGDVDLPFVLTELVPDASDGGIRSEFVNLFIEKMDSLDEFTLFVRQPDGREIVLVSTDKEVHGYTKFPPKDAFASFPDVLAKLGHAYDGIDPFVCLISPFI